MTATSTSTLPGKIVCQETVEWIASCGCGYSEVIATGHYHDAGVWREAERHGWWRDDRGWMCPVCSLGKAKQRGLKR